MALSDNLRGALYMNVAMAAFTLNDAGMKAATQSLPLFEAITLRGAITSVLLIGLGLGTGACATACRGTTPVSPASGPWPKWGRRCCF